MNIDEVFFEKYKQQNYDKNNVIKDIKKIIKKSEYVYIYGNLNNVSNKEWIESFQVDIFLESQHLNDKVVYVYTIENKIYKIRIKEDNIEKLCNTLINIVNKIVDNQKLDIHFIFVNKGKGLLEINLDKNEYIVENSEMKNKFFILVLMIGIICLIIYILIFQYKMVFKVSESKKIGIIEGEYSCLYDNVKYNSNPKEKNSELTHGDKMLQFLNDVSDNLEIYYYDASSEDGKINTNNILTALNYLKEQNVKIINMSLSSKTYSSEIERWVKENSDIKVFASYNNLSNSIDYPAMYEGVFGSGKKSDIKYKENDYTYYTNKIIIFPNIFNVYEGNSYLSLYNSIRK